MKDNRGFTLIELIVVMLIMAIVAAGSMAGYNLLYMGSARHACESIVTALDAVQMENMTKAELYFLEIAKDAATGKYILRVISQDASGDRREVSEETLKLKNGLITYEAGGVSHTVDASAKLEVGFRKDSGGVRKNSYDEIIIRIGVASNGTTGYIRLVTATGKHFIE